MNSVDWGCDNEFTEYRAVHSTAKGRNQKRFTAEGAENAEKTRTYIKILIEIQEAAG
jgi:hypothetical protein